MTNANDLTEEATASQAAYLDQLTAATLFGDTATLTKALSITLTKSTASELIDALKNWRQIHPTRRQANTMLTAIQNAEDKIALAALDAIVQQLTDAAGDFDPAADLFWDNDGWGVETDEFDATLTRRTGNIEIEEF